MLKRTDRVPDDRWFAGLVEWLEQSDELLLAFTPAGCGGSTGYLFCCSVDDVRRAVDRHSDAARIIAYRTHSLSAAQVIDDVFVQSALARIRDGSDFLLIRTAARQYSFGLSGHHGTGHDDLREYLQDYVGEAVRLGGDPERENEEAGISVVYKGGLIGAY